MFNFFSNEKVIHLLEDSDSFHPKSKINLDIMPSNESLRKLFELRFLYS
jgi:hypothetical protein